MKCITCKKEFDVGYCEECHDRIIATLQVLSLKYEKAQDKLGLVQILLTKDTKTRVGNK